MMRCHLNDWITKNSGFHLVHPLLLHFLLTLMIAAVMLCPVLWRGPCSKHRARSPVNRHLGTGAPSPTTCEEPNPAHNHIEADSILVELQDDCSLVKDPEPTYTAKSCKFPTPL